MTRQAPNSSALGDNLRGPSDEYACKKTEAKRAALEKRSEELSRCGGV